MKILFSGSRGLRHGMTGVTVGWIRMRSIRNPSYNARARSMSRKSMSLRAQRSNPVLSTERSHFPVK